MRRVKRNHSPDEPPDGTSEQPHDAATPPWILVVGVLLLIVPFVFWRQPIASVFADREHLLSLIRNAGPLGPLLLVALTVVQVIAAPVPGQFIGFGAGYAFGFWLGSLYNWVGTIVGSAIAIALARVAGRPLLVRLAQRGALERLDRYARGHGLGFFLLVFLIPFLPDDLACFLAGLTSLPLSILLPLVAIARIPGVLTSVWVGAHAEELPWQAWSALAVVIVVALCVAWRSGDRIQERLLSWIDRHSH